MRRRIGNSFLIKVGYTADKDYITLTVTVIAKNLIQYKLTTRIGETRNLTTNFFSLNDDREMESSSTNTKNNKELLDTVLEDIGITEAEYGSFTLWYCENNGIGKNRLNKEVGIGNNKEKETTKVKDIKELEIEEIWDAYGDSGYWYAVKDAKCIITAYDKKGKGLETKEVLVSYHLGNRDVFIS